MSLSPADINAILASLQASEWDSAVVEIDDVRIAVARNGVPLDGTSSVTAASPDPRHVPSAAPAAPAAAAPAAPATPAAAPADGDIIVESPSVGVFWAAPSPGAAPFVEVGARVEAGDTLAIIEIMKLMNNIATPASGVIVAIHQDNSAPVEFGTPLFTIRPEG